MKNERRPEITIRTNGITGTEILVDGKKLDGVTGFRFSQSYRENSGLPILQIDMKATNVSLDAQMLPALPEPFNGHYVPVSSLLNSKVISKETADELCKEGGIDLCVLPSQEADPEPPYKKQIESAKSKLDQYVQQCGETDLTRMTRSSLEKLQRSDIGKAESLNVAREILAGWAEYAKRIVLEADGEAIGNSDKI